MADLSTYGEVRLSGNVLDIINKIYTWEVPRTLPRPQRELKSVSLGYHILLQYQAHKIYVKKL
jgi:hypothetical protein